MCLFFCQEIRGENEPDFFLNPSYSDCGNKLLQECQVGMNAVNSQKFSMLISAQQGTHT